ncbi:uncharacterized protein LOC129279836 [Lytechinus pictus]|uniref:uncharacterized protein LOC129279836 n=1 Tax=Lytechinus pictus TaxID=7653 RepID=UPI0030B9B5AD
MTGGRAFMLLCILMVMRVRESLSVSQFLSDFGLCIVDKDLNSTFPTGMAMFRTGVPPHQDLIFTTDPVFERGTSASYNAALGEIEVNDDGTYVFIIHRAGLATTVSSLPLLLEVKNGTDDYVTVAELVDSREGTILTAHVLAELKRNDSVFIHTQGENVIGNEDRPFIFSMFLLYHKTLVSFPRARQAAFSVTGSANLSFADSIINDLGDPTVNIGNGFDEQTGVFTAPFEGLYVFHLAVTFIPLGGGGGRGVVALQVNGDTIAQVTARVTVGIVQFRWIPFVPAQNGAITIAYPLNLGDEISLRNVISIESLEGKVMFVGYLLA